MTESTVVVRVDEDLKSEFANAAKAADRSTSQLLRDFMRDFVKSQREASAYDAWFRGKVAEGIADARAGRVRPASAVERHFAERRKKSLKRAASK